MGQKLLKARIMCVLFVTEYLSFDSHSILSEDEVQVCNFLPSGHTNSFTNSFLPCCVQVSDLLCFASFENGRNTVQKALLRWWWWTSLVYVFLSVFLLCSGFPSWTFLRQFNCISFSPFQHFTLLPILITFSIRDFQVSFVQLLKVTIIRNNGNEEEGKCPSHHHHHLQSFHFLPLSKRFSFVAFQDHCIRGREDSTESKIQRLKVNILVVVVQRENEKRSRCLGLKELKKSGSTGFSCSMLNMNISHDSRNNNISKLSLFLLLLLSRSLSLPLLIV